MIRQRMLLFLINIRSVHNLWHPSGLRGNDSSQAQPLYYLAGFCAKYQNSVYVTFSTIEQQKCFKKYMLIKNQITTSLRGLGGACLIFLPTSSIAQYVAERAHETVSSQRVGHQCLQDCAERLTTFLILAAVWKLWALTGGRDGCAHKGFAD